MADKMYVVLDGQKYTGKHRVYSEGQNVPASEIFGSLEVALNGQKEMKSKEGAIQRKAKPAKLKVKADKKAKADK